MTTTDTRTIPEINDIRHAQRALKRERRRFEIARAEELDPLAAELEAAAIDERKEEARLAAAREVTAEVQRRHAPVAAKFAARAAALDAEAERLGPDVPGV